MLTVTHLHEHRPGGGDDAEEDEHGQLAEGRVAVGALATGVEPGGGDADGADGEQPPLLGVSQTIARPATAAMPKKTSAAVRTARGRARPEPTRRGGPTRFLSVPRMPSE